MQTSMTINTLSYNVVSEIIILESKFPKPIHQSPAETFGLVIKHTQKKIYKMIQNISPLVGEKDWGYEPPLGTRRTKRHIWREAM